MTRTKALANAASWATSASGLYARSTRSRDDAQRLLTNGRDPFDPEVEQLAARSAADETDLHIELEFARTWAAIAAATPEEPQP
ncbi:hypothetical protein ACFC26_09585 [Kitasatospora purpeofusca]|uniref:hypothetical protein n=1 Tax=Kitasatospora purpeofusca TaxID=67352 RepID=UPI0035E3A1CB